MVAIWCNNLWHLALSPADLFLIANWREKKILPAASLDLPVNFSLKLLVIIPGRVAGFISGYGSQEVLLYRIPSVLVLLIFYFQLRICLSFFLVSQYLLYLSISAPPRFSHLSPISLPISLPICLPSFSFQPNFIYRSVL